MSPAVSVVVPTRARLPLLLRCLASLERQTHGRYEVLVVDDEPAAATERAVRRLSERFRVPLEYLSNPASLGPAAARNRGAYRARGGLLAFIDDDAMAGPRWIESAAAAFSRDPRLVAVTGRTVVPLPPGPTDYQRNLARLEESEFLAANLFVRRSAFWEVGGFDPAFRIAWREDSDLHFRLLSRYGAGAIRREPEAVVVHPARTAPFGASVAEQRKNLYNALLYRKNKALYRERIQRHPPFLYYFAVAALLLGGARLRRGDLAAGRALLAGWAAATLGLFARRITGCRKTLPHAAEMLLTSALIPPAAVFWRLAGAVRYRTPFL